MRKYRSPEWALDALYRMSRLGINRVQLSVMLGMNYTAMCGRMAGSLPDKPGVREKILAKIDELERGVLPAVDGIGVSGRGCSDAPRAGN